MLDVEVETLRYEVVSIVLGGPLDSCQDFFIQ
jgi:hypothetical protein